MARIHYCYLNGLRYAFAVSDTEYAKMRQWNPQEGTHPPVTPKRALELAKKRLTEIKIPNGYGWLLERVSLEPVNVFYPDGKWVYVVSFRYFIEGPSTGAWPTMDFFVTMDDKLVEPIVDTEKQDP
jgi:hypothetical protein